MRRYDFTAEGGTLYLPEHPEGRFVLYTGIEQQLQQAHREGWEQGKREAKEAVDDCKVLAMYVRQYHEQDPQEYFYDENLHTQICVCPACTIARKYQEKVL